MTLSHRGPIVVTGAAGFVGSNLVAELLRREPGADVLAVDDCRSGSFANLVDGCRRAGLDAFTGDFLAASTGDLDWLAMFDEIEPGAVFHLAAITDTTVADERTMMRDNVEGFRELLLACVERDVPLVYASSAATFGSPQQGEARKPFPESAAGEPSNVYGFSKWVMENLHRRADAACAQRDGRPPHVVGLRYFNVFGPGEARKGRMASMAHQLAMQILSGARPRLFTAGEQARDQVYVDDVVACTLRGAEAGVEPGVYNCGSGTATSFNDVLDAVRDGLGVSAQEAPVEYFEMPAHVRRFYQDYTCADMSAARAGLGFSPAHAPVDAIREYAAWMRRTHAEEGAAAAEA